ncbi:hypothetical protein ACFSTI_26225 [Rhizorhabdus histidinilytica]
MLDAFCQWRISSWRTTFPVGSLRPWQVDPAQEATPTWTAPVAADAEAATARSAVPVVARKSSAMPRTAAPKSPQTQDSLLETLPPIRRSLTADAHS